MATGGGDTHRIYPAIPFPHSHTGQNGLNPFCPVFLLPSGGMYSSFLVIKGTSMSHPEGVRYEYHRTAQYTMLLPFGRDTVYCLYGVIDIQPLRGCKKKQSCFKLETIVFCFPTPCLCLSSDFRKTHFFPPTPCLYLRLRYLLSRYSPLSKFLLTRRVIND